MDSLDLFGHITKQETLTSLENINFSHYGILETSRPFPGYHGKNLPDEEKPRSLFLLLNSSHSTEEIARHTKFIKEKLGLDFHAANGSVLLHPYSYSCLRIKHLSSFNNLPGIIKGYEERGLQFNHKKNIHEDALITVYKNFLVHEKEQEIYDDLEDPYKCYIGIPENISWDHFRELTSHVKNNLINNNFDAARGVFFRARGITDMIRIYDQDKNLERTRTIRKMYQEEIEKTKK